VEGKAVTGMGAANTAVMLVTDGEYWISDSEANSEVADEAEYDDGASEPGIKESLRMGSKDSSNAGESGTAIDVFRVGVSEGKLRFGLAGRAD
jgi:hypothetical protein